MADTALVVTLVGLALGAAAHARPLPPSPRPAAQPLPRYLTEAERAYLRAHPLRVPEAVTPPPTGPVHCVAEYEPMDGIIISWMSFTSQLSQLGKHITTSGNANLYVALPSAAQQGTATTLLTNAGANMARVKFFVVPTGLNSVWVRDYGPRYIYQGDCRAIVDHTYNRPRPFDDIFPIAFSNWKHHAFYELPLIHGGGNYHLDAVGRSYCTRLINNENPTLTELQIHDIWQSYQNVDTHFFQPFPTSVDLTQHIDMWMQVFDDDKVMISDWPMNAGSTQDQICDGAASYMASQGYTVHRVPARSIGSPSSVHYTYTNVVICNGIVIVPTYTNATVSPHNAEALAAWAAAMPNHTVIPLDGQAIVGLAGVFHCIVMHVPAHRGGLNPTAYLVNLNGGEVLQPGAVQNIKWISDDDESVSNVDILLSKDGGATFPITIASATADDGSFDWTVPNTYAPDARIRIVARDAGARTGSDDSDASFTIDGCKSDFNRDGVLNVNDHIAFQTAFALGNPQADIDGNGVLNVNDYIAFQTAFALGCV